MRLFFSSHSTVVFLSLGFITAQTWSHLLHCMVPSIHVPEQMQRQRLHFSSPVNPHKENCIPSASTQTTATAR